jgi:hypothetical protein
MEKESVWKDQWKPVDEESSDSQDETNLISQPVAGTHTHVKYLSLGRETILTCAVCPRRCEKRF